MTPLLPLHGRARAWETPARPEPEELMHSAQRELKTEDGLAVTTQDPPPITGRFDAISFGRGRFNISSVKEPLRVWQRPPLFQEGTRLWQRLLGSGSGSGSDDDNVNLEC